ncbi:MAG TPA: copper resistance protein CopC, partial [Acidimicrobiales bacterium]|nr:copper resistance protein CopC [Acidimicrobiales bacterium]
MLRPVRRAAPPGPGPGRRARRVLVAAATVLAAVIVSGSPASAHAVLVGSDPPSGAITAQPPTAIRLRFSGPVELRFSGIQLLDPDGRKLPAGRLGLDDGGRGLALPVSPTRTGTYTVAWEALSTDGHPSQGQIRFSIGAPSAGTTGAAAPARVAHTGVGVVFAVVRFCWLAAFAFLVGAVVLRRFVWAPAMRSASAARSAADVDFDRRFATALPLAWAVAAAAGAVSLLLESATVSNRPGWGSLRPEQLSRLLLGTSYGRLWIAQMLLVLALALPVLALSRRPTLGGLSPGLWLGIGALAVGGLDVVVVLGGHARTAPHPTAAVVMLSLHLMAAAVWAGGLAALVVLCVPGWRALPDTRRAWRVRPVLVREVLPRFSRLAIASTVMLVATGILSAGGSVGVLSNLWRAGYGRFLLAKVALLLV